MSECYGANPDLSRAEFTGHAKVRRFFEPILDRLEITAFNAEQFVVEGDTDADRDRVREGRRATISQRS